MDFQPSVYMMTNAHHTVLYVGVTSSLVKRIYEHRSHVIDGFTKKYNCDLCVYYEVIDDMESAILREKQIKAGSRRKKEALIESINPQWQDLYPRITGSELREIRVAALRCASGAASRSSSQ